MPKQQESFIAAIVEGRKNIGDSKTDLQSSNALFERDKALCALLPGSLGSNWVGTITDIGANGEGKAYLTIEFADNARVQTWNNAFSDMGDNTLIPNTSELFKVLVPLGEGTKVKFSAEFLRGKDTCLKKGNLTKTFYGIDPEFMVRFTKVEKLK